MQEALFGGRIRAAPAAPRASPRVHVRAAVGPRPQPAMRARRRRRRAGRGQPWRRHHLPRAGSARRLSDPQRRQQARRRRPRQQRRAGRHRHARRLRRRSPAASPSTRACGSTPAAATRARSVPSACASRPAARCTASPSTSPPTWPTCASTSWRAGSATGRSRRCARRASTSRCARSSTSCARIAGERWGHGRMERQDVAWRHRPEDLSLFSRGAGPGDDRSRARSARRRRCA